MEQVALYLGYALIDVLSLVALAFTLFGLWFYLSRAVHHAYIATLAFNTYPNGPYWNDGYAEKKFKFIRNLWHNLMNPRQTIRGWGSTYYTVGHKGWMPYGFVRGEFTGG